MDLKEVESEFVICGMQPSGSKWGFQSAEQLPATQK
jgi:hypothetical protein